MTALADGQLLTASAWHRPVVSEKAKDELARQRANTACAMARLDEPRPMWPLLRNVPEPRERTFLIHRAARLAVKPETLIERYAAEQDAGIRQALLLALGEYGNEEISPDLKADFTRQMLEWYGQEPDPGIHSAAEWLLRKWGNQAPLKALDAELASPAATGDRKWYVNGQGHTLAVVTGPVEFRMAPRKVSRIRATTSDRIPAGSAARLPSPRKRRPSSSSSGSWPPIPAFATISTKTPGQHRPARRLCDLV